jgi:predicted Rossmann fold nucleotide-binding protein DprA/Smf involved in DNA uptake
MTPYDSWLKMFAIGLETVSKGIHVIANTIYEMADGKAKQEPAKAEPEPIKAETAPGKAAEKIIPEGVNALPSTDQVLDVIRKWKTGVDNVTISKQTGLDQKQVSNALSGLKKAGKIKSVRRGVHITA